VAELEKYIHVGKTEKCKSSSQPGLFPVDEEKTGKGPSASGGMEPLRRYPWREKRKSLASTWEREKKGLGGDRHGKLAEIGRLSREGERGI